MIKKLIKWWNERKERIKKEEETSAYFAMEDRRWHKEQGHIERRSAIDLKMGRYGSWIDKKRR